MAQADVFLHQAFDEQEQDNAAIEDGDGQQVHDAEIEADGGGDQEKRRPAFLAGGGTDGAADSDGAIDLAHGNLAFGHLAQQFEDEERTLFIVVERAAGTPAGKPSLTTLHGRSLATPIR